MKSLTEEDGITQEDRECVEKNCCPYEQRHYSEEKVLSALALAKKEMCRCKTMVGVGKKCYACRTLNDAIENKRRKENEMPIL